MIKCGILSSRRGETPLTPRRGEEKLEILSSRRGETPLTPRRGKKAMQHFEFQLR